MSPTESIVAVFHTHASAEQAVKEIQYAGMDMKTLSIVAMDYHTDEYEVGYYNAGDRVKRWGKTGAVCGGSWGLLLGSAFFAMPGLDLLLIGGPWVAWIVAALGGMVAVGGVSALGTSLLGMGIPKNSFFQYELAIKNDKFLLIVNSAESARAFERVASSGFFNWLR